MKVNEYKPNGGWLKFYRRKRILEEAKFYGMLLLSLLFYFCIASLINNV